MMVARAIIPAQIHTWENLLFQKLKIKTLEIFFPNTRTQSSITSICIPIRNLCCYHGVIRKSRCQFMIDILRWQIRCEFILIKKISAAYLNSHIFGHCCWYHHYLLYTSRPMKSFMRHTTRTMRLDAYLAYYIRPPAVQ